MIAEYAKLTPISAVASRIFKLTSLILYIQKEKKNS